jgi:hypothetical protein
MKPLCYGTLTMCDATSSDVYVVLYYVLSQYHEDEQTNEGKHLLLKYSIVVLVVKVMFRKVVNNAVRMHGYFHRV